MGASLKKMFYDQERLHRIHIYELLVESARHGDVDTVNRILETELIDVNNGAWNLKAYGSVEYNYTPLMAIVSSYDITVNQQQCDAILDAFVKAGADLLLSCGDKTTLTVSISKVPCFDAGVEFVRDYFPLALIKHLPLTALNASDGSGMTALHYACYYNNPAVVSALLDKGVDFEVLTEKQQLTPLHEACIHASTVIVNMLIKAGADVNTVSHFEVTPLHNACHGGHVSMVKALVEARANLYAKDKFGKTALEFANERGNNEVIEFMTKACQDHSE